MLAVFESRFRRGLRRGKGCIQRWISSIHGNCVRNFLTLPDFRKNTRLEISDPL